MSVSVKGTGGLAVPITLPDIHLTNLGQGREGITASELTEKVLSEITNAVARHAGNVITKDGFPHRGKAAMDSVEKVTKRVIDLFEKNKE